MLEGLEARELLTGTVTMSALESQAAEAGPVRGRIQVSISDPPPQSSATTVIFYIVGTAVADTDYWLSGSNVSYSTSGGSVTIPPGLTSTTFDLVPLADSFDNEGTEYATFALAPPYAYNDDFGQYYPGNPQGGTIAIADGQGQAGPTVSLSLSGSPMAEAWGNATVTATLSSVSSQDVTVDLEFSGTATFLDDYIIHPGTEITIPAGNMSGWVTLTAVQDTRDETGETIVVDITGVTNGAENGTQQVTATIIDDDPAPTVSLSLSGSPMPEAEGVATVTATLSAVSGQDVTVDLGFSGTAVVTEDYTPSSTQITIPAGYMIGSLALTAVSDTWDEPDETIVVDITGVTNAMENGTQQVTATIIDDDPAPTVSLSLSGSPMAEAWGVATVTATLSAVSGLDVTVGLDFSGTAVLTEDYTASSTQITIPAGSTSGSITLTAFPDADYTDETIVVDIDGVTNGTENGTQQVTATITDDDASDWLVSIEANDAAAYEPMSSSEAGDRGRFRVYRTGEYDISQVLNVNYDVSGRADNGVDYGSLTGAVEIPAYAEEAFIDVGPVYDGAAEGAENVVLTITAGTGYTPGSSPTARVTIQESGTNSPKTQCPQCGDANVAVSTNDADGSLVLCYEPYCIGYASGSNPHPIATTDVKLQPTNGSATLTRVEVSTNLDGVQTGTVYYEGAGVTADVTYRFSTQADASTLSSGRHNWTMTILQRYSDGSTLSDTYHGQQDLLNGINSVFGNRWGTKITERLAPNPEGVTLISAGNSSFYWSDGASPDYTTERGGDVRALTGSWTGGFTLTGLDGSIETFNALGVLTSSRDRVGNTTTYSYIDANNDGMADELSQVTDPSSRTTQFIYTNGLLTQGTDFAGRVTAFAYDASNRLISITEPDPDGTVPMNGPLWQFGYDPTTGLMTSMTDPAGNTTAYGYGFARTLQSITWPDNTTQTLDAIQASALVDTGTGVGTETYPAPLIRIADIEGTRHDEENHSETFTVDRFGWRTSTTDALGNTTTYERNDDGLVTRMVEPDPDDGGLLDAPVTQYAYDARRNLFQVTLPDNSTRVWTYDPTFNQLTSYTDELGHQTLYTLDPANGNTLSERVVFGQVDSPQNGETDDLVTGYTYTPQPVYSTDPPAGLVATVTDPLGQITRYAYNAHGLLTGITYALGTIDEALVQYEYDASDNMIAAIDELGRRTTYVPDSVGRVTSVIWPDPDGTGGQEAPVTRYEYDPMHRLTRETDPLLRNTDYAYDDRGRLFRITRPDHDNNGQLTITAMTYWPTGELETITDPLGGVTTYDYDEIGRNFSVTLPGPDSPVALYAYDNIGRLIRETDPLSNVTSYVYENHGRRVIVTGADPDGIPQHEPDSPVTTYDYDSAGNLVEVTQPDPDGEGPLSRVTTYAYDAANRLTRVTLPAPDDTSPRPYTIYGYDKAGNLETVDDPLRNVTTYVYNKRNWETDRILPDPDGTGPGQTLEPPVYKTRYYADGQLWWVTLPDPDGAAGPLSGPVTYYEYDNLGRVTSRRDPDPDWGGPAGEPFTQYAYDAVGNLTSVTDPLLRVTGYAYDALDSLIRVTAPDPDGPAAPLTSPVTSYAYDAVANLTSQTDPRSHTTTYGYDAMNRRTSVTDAFNQTTVYDYDATGNLTSVTNALGEITVYAYDHLLRRTKVIGPDPEWDEVDTPETIYGYDAAGRLASVTDPLGFVTSYKYDGLDRKTKTIEPGPTAPTTVYTYDAAGNMRTLRDPELNTTTWIYDNLYRVKQETNQLGQSRFFKYNNAGYLDERTDRNGRVMKFLYDNLGRTTDEVWKDGVTEVRRLSYTYDAADQRLSASDPAATYTYTYDNLGRATSINGVIAGLTPSVRLDQVFDATDNRTNLYAYVADTYSVGNYYTYDNLDRMIEVFQGSPPGAGGVLKTADFSYDPLNRLTGVTMEQHASGIGWKTAAVAAYDYDGASRLRDLTYRKSAGGVTLAAYHWDYDKADRVTYATWTLGGTANYTYDSTDQLTDATYTSTYQSTEDYAYDDNGNRTGGNYLTGSDNRLTRDATYTYTYDAEGNRTRRTKISNGSVTDYTWDHRNRLTSVIQRASAGGAATKKTNYTYDVENRLVKKAHDPDGAGSQGWSYTYFVYDGQQMLMRFTGSQASSLANRYLWGPAVDQFLSDEKVNPAGTTGTLYWAFTDNLGTVRDLALLNMSTDVTTIANHREYDAFGNVKRETNAAVDVIFGYTGRMFDTATGLQNNLNRWYDPKVGRWLSQDPIGFEGGDGNLYRYVGNSPTNATDPSGLQGFNPVMTGDASDIRMASGIVDAIRKLLLIETKEEYEARMRRKIGAMQRKANLACMRLHPDTAGFNRMFTGERPRLSTGPVDHVIMALEILMLSGAAEGAAASRAAFGALDRSGAACRFRTPSNAAWVDSSVFREVPFELPCKSVIIGAEARPIISRHIAGLGFEAAPEPTLSAFTQRYLAGSGGRWGGTDTRVLNYALGNILERWGYKVTFGGGKASEQWIPGLEGLKGGTWVDLTATNGTTTIRIQTIRTLADCVTPIPEEAAAAARIRTKYPNDILLLIPKD